MVIVRERILASNCTYFRTDRIFGESGLSERNLWFRAWAWEIPIFEEVFDAFYCGFMGSEWAFMPGVFYQAEFRYSDPSC